MRRHYFLAALAALALGIWSPAARAATYRNFVAQVPPAPNSNQTVRVWMDSDTAFGETAAIEYLVGSEYKRVYGTYDTTGYPGANWYADIPAQAVSTEVAYQLLTRNESASDYGFTGFNWNYTVTSDVRVYSPACWIAPPLSATTNQNVAVNRNPGSPYKGYVYVCETGVEKKVKIYRPVSATQYEDTGWRVTPAGTPGTLNPYAVQIASDDSIWTMDVNANSFISSAVHPGPGHETEASTQRVDIQDSTITGVRGFAVNGNITAARLYVPSSTNPKPYHIYDVNGATVPTAPSATTTGTRGYNTFQATFDAAGNSYLASGSAAGWIDKYGPPSAGVIPAAVSIAPKLSWWPSPAVQGIDFVQDPTYTGGGYFIFSLRATSPAPYKIAVLRLSAAGTYLDGFGPALAGAPTDGTYTVIDIAMSASTFNPYVGADSQGNVFLRVSDGTNSGIMKFSFNTNPVVPAPGDVVISQAYGGGGNVGADLKNDFIELYNRSNKTFNMAGWTLQYASSAGNFPASLSSTASTVLGGTLAPGQYYLVQEAAGTAGTVNLPAPEATGYIAMGGTGFKVALASNMTALGAVACPTGGAIIDFLGASSAATCYEGAAPAPAPSNTTSVIRACTGADTNNNAADFTVTAPLPRNSAYVAPPATFYRDLDNDGYGNPADTVQAVCTPPPGYVANDADCDDANSAIHPGATELQDGLDNNCDGFVDEGFAAKLAFITQPGPGKEGQPLSVQPTVAVQDAFGALVSGFSGFVNVALKPGTGTAGASLSGTATVVVVNGVATFTDLSVGTVGSGYQLSATSGVLAGADSNPFAVGGKAEGPWGDVDQDGFVTLADALLVAQYVADPTPLALPLRERIVRYGDVNGTQNVSTVGDGTTDINDVLRIAKLACGILDPGTAGPAYTHYGDVDNDGKVTVADVVTVARFLNGLETDAGVLSRIQAAGVGDVYPTSQKIVFGDGAITAADTALIRERAMGTEANPPAYQDYWPMVTGDQYLFTDRNGRSGDALNQINFLTKTASAPSGYSFDGRGYTVTEVAGDDAGSLAGVYKGINGSLYALYAQFPYFSAQRMDFQSPMKVLDTTKLTVGSEWTGDVLAKTSFGIRPLHYKVTVLKAGDTYTKGAGANETAAPIHSTWSNTVSVRIDIAVYGTLNDPMEMQQAIFFDFAPGIGVVRRGQAAIQGSPAPLNDRPLIELDRVTTRGITYDETHPIP